MFCFIMAINKIDHLLSKEEFEKIKAHANYTKDAKELYDQMATDIQVGRDLTKVKNKFN